MLDISDDEPITDQPRSFKPSESNEGHLNSELSDSNKNPEPNLDRSCATFCEDLLRCCL